MSKDLDSASKKIEKRPVGGRRPPTGRRPRRLRAREHSTGSYGSLAITCSHAVAHQTHAVGAGHTHFRWLADPAPSE
jgi:hypothetical protein